MSLYPTMRVEVQLSSTAFDEGAFDTAAFDGGGWVDLCAGRGDVADGLNLRYGVQGNGPTDCLASTGSCSFRLRNDAGNTGGTLGWYSPAHASKRSGWTFGIPIRVVFTYETALSVSSITRVTTTATVTTGSAHGWSTGAWVLLAGADQSEYTGVVQITVTGPSTFTFTVANAPTTPATGTSTATRAYVRFRGKIRSISPEAGAYGSRRVNVVAHDGMADLMEADVRQVTVQVDQAEDALIGVVLNALPAEAQPIARAIDLGVDVYPYAFDEVAGGTKAAALIRDVVFSAQGFAFIKGDGTFVYQTRSSRVIVASSYTFANTMHGLEVNTALDKAFNRVRVTVHPKSIDVSATTVLYALTGAPPDISPGSTLTLWGAYRDPTDPTVAIGGTAQVTPLVSTTDYTANSVADGSGTDLTSSLSIVTTAFSSTAKFEITNTHATLDFFLTKLQIRGKGVYDLAPQTVESLSTQTYGDRPLNMDLPLQDDANVAQDMAAFIRNQREGLTQQPDSIEFLANVSSALLTQALSREPGDRITISETVTGVSAVDAYIQSVELEVLPGMLMKCRWLLAPAFVGSVFVLDDAVAGVLDSSALGYA